MDKKTSTLILAALVIVLTAMLAPSDVPTDRLVRLLDSTCLVAPELEQR